MTAAAITILSATMLGTAFLSGVFGMAGGLILMGVLLTMLPVAEAMSLHAVTQMASNAWRGVLWIKYVRWRAAGNFLLGSALSFIAWSWWQYIPPKPLAFLLLGTAPFLTRALPADLKPDPMKLGHGICYGAVCMILMLLAGVSGPMLDTYFLGGGFERRQIIATKAACQLLSHLAKLVYFGGLVTQGAGIDPLLAGIAVVASIAGTSLARPVLERLTDTQYRKYTGHIITVVAVFYLAEAGYLLMK